MKRVKVTFLNAFGQAEGEVKWFPYTSSFEGQQLGPEYLMAELFEDIGVQKHRQVIRLSNTNAHGNLYSILLELVDA